MPGTSHIRVVRLCSVFEPPPESLSGRGVRFDPIGGMQNHTASLTRALDTRGIVQQVVTTRPPGAPATHRLGAHARVHRLGLPVPVARQFYSVPAALLVDRLARGASVLHAHLGEDLAIVPIALAASRRRRIPWVLTIHASLAHTLSGGGLHGTLMRQAGGRLERVGTARADAVITLTKRLAAMLAADGVNPERIHVIPSGVVPSVPLEPVEPFLRRDGRPRVLFVGRLAEQKGVAHLIEAAARLRTPGVDVLLVGDGPQRRELEALAHRLGVQERVRFAGFRPHDAIAGVLSTGDVLVLPSLYEELGSVLLEGMQAGLPIVASRTGGIADAVGDAGVLVAPGDADALAREIDALLADASRRAALSNTARERARNYHWDTLADQVLDVYRGALEQRG